MAINTQTRKVGDTLRLSGELSGDTIPSLAAGWAGATAVLNIVRDRDAAVYRVREPVTLDVDAAPWRFTYAGDAPVTADIGTYRYEVEVTFADTTVTTFPNTADKYLLKIVADIA